MLTASGAPVQEWRRSCLFPNLGARPDQPSSRCPTPCDRLHSDPRKSSCPSIQARCGFPAHAIRRNPDARCAAFRHRGGVDADRVSQLCPGGLQWVDEAKLSLDGLWTGVCNDLRRRAKTRLRRQAARTYLRASRRIPRRLHGGVTALSSNKVKNHRNSAPPRHTGSGDYVEKSAARAEAQPH